VQKKWLKLAVASSFVFLQTRGASAGAPSESGAPPSQIISRSVFRGMMNDPELNRLHLRAQERRLKTSIDYQMQQYFDSNPLVQTLLPPFLDELNKNVLSTTTQNQLTMTEITDQSNPSLRYKLEQMMRIQGYSDKQIADTVFYRAQGEMNAYAYTFSTDKVGFVLLSGLDDVASRRELIGVFGHESGHIRSGHVKYSSVDSVMQILLMKALIAKNNGPPGFLDTITSRQQILEDMIHQRVGTTIKSALGTNRQDDPRIKTISRLLEKAAKSPVSSNNEEEAKILTDYIDQILLHLRTLEVPAKYVAILENAKERLKPGDVININIEQVEEALRVWSAAYSREIETTADYFGSIVGRPSWVAMMFAKFAGQKVPAKSSNKDREDIVASSTQQIKKAQQMNTREDYYEIIGGPNSSDHPLSNLRVLKLAKFDQSIDRVALENPFLQVVVDLDQARDELGEVEQNIKMVQTVQKEQSETITKEDLHNLDVVLKQLLVKKEEALRSISKIEPQIKALLEDPRFEKKHPRATDLLDYRLAQKQLLESRIAALERLAPANDPNMKQARAFVKGAVAELVRDPLLKLAANSIKNSKAAESEKEALNLALKALKSSSTLEDTAKARSAFASLSKSRSRIGLEPELMPKSSTTSSEAQGVFKDEAAAKKTATAPKRTAPPKNLTCPGLF
jgi:hypothetical protein